MTNIVVLLWWGFLLVKECLDASNKSSQRLVVDWVKFYIILTSEISYWGISACFIALVSVVGYDWPLCIILLHAHTEIHRITVGMNWQINKTTNLWYTIPYGPYNWNRLATHSMRPRMAVAYVTRSTTVTCCLREAGVGCTGVAARPLSLCVAARFTYAMWFRIVCRVKSASPVST